VGDVAEERPGGVIEPGESVRVQCYASTGGEELPHRVLREGRWTDIAVVERWVSEAVETGSRHRCLRVRLAGGQEGVLSHDETLDLWFWRESSGPP
jgi:hypothetical protein